MRWSPPQGRHEIVQLEFVRAVTGQRRGRHVGHHRDGHGERPEAHATELLAENDRVGVVRALAAVGRVVLEAEQTGGAEGLEDRMAREAVSPFPLLQVREHLALEHPTYAASKDVVLLGEAHAPPRFEATARAAGHADART